MSWYMRFAFWRLIVDRYWGCLRKDESPLSKLVLSIVLAVNGLRRSLSSAADKGNCGGGGRGSVADDVDAIGICVDNPGWSSGSAGGCEEEEDDDDDGGGNCGWGGVGG